MSINEEEDAIDNPEMVYYALTNLNDSFPPPSSQTQNDLFSFIKIKKEVLYRLIIILFFLIAISANSIYGIFLPKENPNLTGVEDRFFFFINFINNYFTNHLLVTRIFFTITTLGIDIIFVYSLLDWIVLCDSIQPLATWIPFYFFRGFLQLFFQFGFIEGCIWIKPFLPSISVPFLQTNDYFFSGHVGMPLIAGLSFAKMNKLPQSIFCFVITFLEICLVITMKAHYSIDVIVGLLFSHYMFLIIEKYSKYIEAVCYWKKVE